MLTDKIAQKLAPAYLSDISQLDALDILVAAVGWRILPSEAFSHCMTDMVCQYFLVSRIRLLSLRNDLWDKFEKDGCYILKGDALREVQQSVDHQDFAGYIEVTFWTPRAMLRLATYLQNPISNSVRVQIAAFVASKTASNWRINESSTLQPELATPPHEIPPSQPELATFSGELATKSEVASSG